MFENKVKVLARSYSDEVGRTTKQSDNHSNSGLLHCVRNDKGRFVFARERSDRSNLIAVVAADCFSLRSGIAMTMVGSADCFATLAKTLAL